jgi:hypothetical protein
MAQAAARRATAAPCRAAAAGERGRLGSSPLEALSMEAAGPVRWAGVRPARTAIGIGDCVTVGFGETRGHRDGQRLALLILLGLPPVRGRGSGLAAARSRVGAALVPPPFVRAQRFFRRRTSSSRLCSGAAAAAMTVVAAWQSWRLAVPAGGRCEDGSAPDALPRATGFAGVAVAASRFTR